MHLPPGKGTAQKHHGAHPKCYKGAAQAQLAPQVGFGGIFAANAGHTHPIQRGGNAGFSIGQVAVNGNHAVFGLGGAQGSLQAVGNLLLEVQQGAQLAGNIRLVIQCVDHNGGNALAFGRKQLFVQRTAVAFIHNTGLPCNFNDLICRQLFQFLLNRAFHQRFCCRGIKKLAYLAGKGRFFKLLQINPFA